MLAKIAKAMNVPVEAIKNFTEENVVNVIQNNYEGSTNNSSNYNYHCTFNPLEKMVELYEELLKTQREMIALLERMNGKG